MFGIGVPELILILIVGLVVFGPGKLPEIARSLGKGMREFKKATSAFSQAINAPLPECTIYEYLWENNYMQHSTDPEEFIFSYGSLRTFETIPETDYKGAYAVIDANRKSGKDFFAMPIFKKVENDNIFDYYLKDAIFTKTATKDLYDDIINKIIEHHIILLVIESNVTSELKQAIENGLKAKGHTFCEIMEKWNEEKKAIRITTEQGVIKRQLVFPKRDMYGINTDIGRFMDNLTTYNSTGSNVNDDAPDSCALFANEIIEENSQLQIAEPLDFVRQYM